MSLSFAACSFPLTPFNMVKLHIAVIPRVQYCMAITALAVDVPDQLHQPLTFAFPKVNNTYRSPKFMSNFNRTYLVSQARRTRIRIYAPPNTYGRLGLEGGVSHAKRVKVIAYWELWKPQPPIETCRPVLINQKILRFQSMYTYNKIH